MSIAALKKQGPRPLRADSTVDNTEKKDKHVYFAKKAKTEGNIVEIPCIKSKINSKNNCTFSLSKLDPEICLPPTIPLLYPSQPSCESIYFKVNLWITPFMEPSTNILDLPGLVLTSSEQAIKLPKTISVARNRTLTFSFQKTDISNYPLIISSEFPPKLQFSLTLYCENEPVAQTRLYNTNINLSSNTKPSSSRIPPIFGEYFSM